MIATPPPPSRPLSPDDIGMDECRVAPSGKAGGDQEPDRERECEPPARSGGLRHRPPAGGNKGATVTPRPTRSPNAKWTIPVSPKTSGFPTAGFVDAARASPVRRLCRLRLYGRARRYFLGTARDVLPRGSFPSSRRGRATPGPERLPHPLEGDLRVVVFLPLREQDLHCRLSRAGPRPGTVRPRRGPDAQ